MNMTSAPSLLDQDHLPPAQMAAAPVNARSLLDLMYDGFYALFMLKNGSAPERSSKDTASASRNRSSHCIPDLADPLPVGRLRALWS